MDTTPVDTLIGSDGPERLEGRAIKLPLPCQRCGYDLQGLSAMAACPECGVSASRSLEAVIDPTTHHLPPLLAPRVVGNALMFLAILCLIACVALGVHIVIRLPWVGGEIPRLANRLNQLGLVVTVLCGLVAWIPLLKMWPAPAGMKGFDGRRGIRFGAVGLVIWIAGCVLAWLFPNDGPFGPDPINLVAMFGGAVFLYGLRGIVVVVGMRSRVFRTDQIRRQRIWDLVIGIGFVALGIVLARFGENVVNWNMAGWLTLGQFTFTGKSISGLAFLGMAMAIVASLLVLVGFIYLCFNMAWVRKALKSPPPRLREYLDELPPSVP
ncbi:MAG: hypothetical protein VX527_03250 [Planctomycetota bacterium]|nr:hypothetical protein [Planctomycetota bacterium]